ncbi:MAG: hypothetical protein OXC10_20935 [Rhodospirillaceae bacterium]|nr:hypothetical protein [Rhodospirillaceae bacterium]
MTDEKTGAGPAAASPRPDPLIGSPFDCFAAARRDHRAGDAAGVVAAMAATVHASFDRIGRAALRRGFCHVMERLAAADAGAGNGDVAAAVAEWWNGLDPAEVEAVRHVLARHGPVWFGPGW